MKPRRRYVGNTYGTKTYLWGPTAIDQCYQGTTVCQMACILLRLDENEPAATVLHEASEAFAGCVSW
jgi:hypothetical protein